ncbi:MAG: magnesium chelatase domain-containing protein [Patescibacteria group bacterium]|nr:magnesium chelatase domain-containing protein [Patescibacteria group bacterium]
MVELLNPSALFLEEGENEKEGSVITAVLEGNRPIILEIQALTSSTSFGYPQRTSSGIDKNRLQLLIAVLQRHTKTKFDSKDVYANIIGGIKSNDRATDLAVALALLSSVKKSVISNKTLAIGEIGLSGEIRKVIQLEKRIEEAEKLGFDTVIIPKTGLSIKSKIKIIEIRSVKDLLNVL